MRRRISPTDRPALKRFMLRFDNIAADEVPQLEEACQTMLTTSRYFMLLFKGLYLIM
jgi:hypothetical protein